MKVLFIALLFSVVSNLPAQEKALVWKTNMKEAADLAIKEKKPLFLYFTGSDWCGVCKRIQKEVFAEPQFQEWASKNVVLVELDFPRNTPIDSTLQQQNQQMKAMFGIRGYPTIVFATPDKRNNEIYYTRIGNTGYVPGGADAWLKSTYAILGEPVKQ